MPLYSSSSCLPSGVKLDPILDWNQGELLEREEFAPRSAPGLGACHACSCAVVDGSKSCEGSSRKDERSVPFGTVTHTTLRHGQSNFSHQPISGIRHSNFTRYHRFVAHVVARCGLRRNADGDGDGDEGGENIGNIPPLVEGFPGYPDFCLDIINM